MDGSPNVIPLVPRTTAPPTRPAARRAQTAAAAALQSSGLALDTAAEWGRRLAVLLPAGHRLLIAGNGGSAAAAQHLSAELVGRYRRDRRPFSAIALHSDTSAITAISNDFGAEEVFARGVQAHGAAGDVLLLLSTSGRSPNLLRAAERAALLGLHTWALTGPRPNPLAAMCHEAAAVESGRTGTIQEIHLVAAHTLCAAMDDALLGEEPAPGVEA